ncbi:putative addiction module antidote protein [Pseudomonas fulva]|nr:putative addiction module antidote protein [Pseudomonas fulva]
MSNTFNHEDMPILDLDLSGTSRFEASRYLDSPEVISAFLAEAMSAHDPAILMQSLAEVAKANGVNQLAEAAGVNRESLYKTLKGGEKTRFDTIQKLLVALGVELTVKPIERLPATLARGLRGVPSKTVADGPKRTTEPLIQPSTQRVKVAAVARSRSKDGQICDKSKTTAKKPTANKSDSTANA